MFWSIAETIKSLSGLRWYWPVQPAKNSQTVTEKKKNYSNRRTKTKEIQSKIKIRQLKYFTFTSRHMKTSTNHVTAHENGGKPVDCSCSCQLVFSDAVTLWTSSVHQTPLIKTLILPHRTADPICLYCVLDRVNTWCRTGPEPRDRHCFPALFVCVSF